MIHVGSRDTLVRKAIIVNLVSLDLISRHQVGAVTDGETELRAKNDEGLLGFTKYVTGLGFYFLANIIVEWSDIKFMIFFLNKKFLFNGVMVVEFARGEMVSGRLTWQKKITRQTVGMCLNCQRVLDNHLGESTNGGVAFANKGELQGLNLQNFKF